MITPPPINGVVVGPDKQFDAAWKRWIGQLYYETAGPVDAFDLSGTTLAPNVVASSLTSVGILSTLAVTSTIVGSVNGNAGTATKLLTARAINGVNFDGTAPITVTAVAGTLTGATLASNVLASSLTSVGTLAALTVTAPITGSVTGSSSSTYGNAATATALAIARAINGVNFDGTAPITVTAAAGTLTGATLASNVLASSLTSVGTLASLGVTGTATAGAFSGPLTGNVTGNVTGSSGSTTGNAATATALATARAINGVNFDGTAPITVTAAAGTLTGATLASGVTASSLTSVGTLTSLALSGAVSGVTALTTTGNTILGDASTDTLNVGNGGLVKDANGNVGVGTSTPTNAAGFGTLAVNGTTGGIFDSFVNGTRTLTIYGISTEARIIALPAIPLTFWTNTLERLRIDSSGQSILQTAGKGISIKEGSNCKQGTATLVLGSSVVSNTSVTASSRILLSIQSLGTVAVPQAIGVTARTAGTSFTITSASTTDTSVIAYEIFEPS